MTSVNGLVDKKYLRVPDFIFQDPPLGYITALGRNALGLNKKKLTFDEIQNLKEKSKKHFEKVKKTNNINLADDFFEAAALNESQKKRDADSKTEDSSFTDQPVLKKQKFSISEEEWLNIPEARKVTKYVRPNIDETRLVANKFNTLDKAVELGEDNLLLFNSVDWKEQIKSVVKTTGNYKKILQKSLKKVLKDPTEENLLFHLDLLQDCVLLRDGSKDIFILNIDSLIRYSFENSLWKQSYSLLSNLEITQYEKSVFLNKYLGNKKENYKQAGWAIHELYFITLAEYTEQDYITKKSMLSKFLSKYGNNIVELLYESCLLESNDKNKIDELVAILPLFEWENYLNMIYEIKPIDSFLTTMIDTMISKRYKKGNLQNLKNLINKFSNKEIKLFILTKIISIDYSVNIWDFFFNFKLENHNDLKLIIDIVDIQLAKSASNSFGDVLKLFMKKYFYFNYSKTTDDINAIKDLMKKYQDKDVVLIEILNMQRELGKVEKEELITFDNFQEIAKNKDNFTYALEIVKFKAQFVTETKDVFAAFEMLLKNYKENEKVYDAYCNYLESKKMYEELYKVAKRGNEQFPFSWGFLESLFVGLNPSQIVIESAKLTAKYTDLLKNHSKSRALIIVLLQKVCYRAIAVESNLSVGISKIDKFMQQHKITDEEVRNEPILGLLVSLRLKLEFQKCNQNNKTVVKALINNYLVRYDNNFLILYQLAFLLKDCKWLLNSIKKNPNFANPYAVIFNLKSSNKVLCFKNYHNFVQTVSIKSLAQIAMPSLKVMELYL
ncbi:hypothetical protein QEN19_001020 [Hanseniaspora menglaensis]